MTPPVFQLFALSSMQFQPNPCISIYLFSLQFSFAVTVFPFLLPLLNKPDFCPASPSASLATISLIVLLSAEGYFCLQGYENVRKAHSIFSYVNSHFPPEQTHFPVYDLSCYASHFPPSSPTAEWEI